MSQLVPPTFVVVSGLPASGKTTLARSLALALGLRLLDKDDILEGLFDAIGVGDAAWRTELSRPSDDVLFRAARASPSAVLVSFWRREVVSPSAGTPTASLSGLPGELVEVFCRCEPDVAARRFVARTRHRGHLDALANIDEIVPRFRELAEQFPMGLGKVVAVDTTNEIDVQTVLDALAPGRC
jgi:adenylylsulfate kinase-like enzyme